MPKWKIVWAISVIAFLALLVVLVVQSGFFSPPTPEELLERELEEIYEQLPPDYDDPMKATSPAALSSLVGATPAKTKAEDWVGRKRMVYEKLLPHGEAAVRYWIDHLSDDPLRTEWGEEAEIVDQIIANKPQISTKTKLDFARTFLQEIELELVPMSSIEGGNMRSLTLSIQNRSRLSDVPLQLEFYLSDNGGPLRKIKSTNPSSVEELLSRSTEEELLSSSTLDAGGYDLYRLAPFTVTTGVPHEIHIFIKFIRLGKQDVTHLNYGIETNKVHIK